MAIKRKFKKGDKVWFFDTYLWREVEVQVSVIVEDGYICIDEDGLRYMAKDDELFATLAELELSL